MAGIAIATIQAFRPHLWRAMLARPNVILAVGFIGVAMSMIFFQRQFPALLPTIFGYPLLSACMALLVMAGSDNRSVIGRYRIPGISALAIGSYSFYLSHKLAFHIIQTCNMPVLNHIYGGRLTLAILLAFAFGTVLYAAIERPGLKIRDRLLKPAQLQQQVSTLIMPSADNRGSGFQTECDWMPAP